MVSAGGSPRRNGGGKSGGCVPTSVESAQNEVVELRGALKRVYSKRQEVNNTLKTVALTVGWAEADVVQACPCATCLGMSPMLISPDIHCRSVRFWGESHLQQQCSWVARQRPSCPPFWSISVSPEVVSVVFMLWCFGTSFVSKLRLQVSGRFSLTNHLGYVRLVHCFWFHTKKIVNPWGRESN